MERLGASYILDERIGSGAQGDVWRGHAEGSDEALAFKVLRPELSRERDVVDAFLKERDTLERVDSPYVVRVHDMVVEGKTLALVMDYVGGGDLSDVLRRQGTITPAMIGWYGSVIAAGLSAIHAAGLVHRDVKPANVLMDDTANPALPRVADFGVARIVDSAGATHSTSGVGTPLYMAPEVADGAAPAPSMDVYSLGVVLYELACGVTPFIGTPIALIKAHSAMRPGRPQGVPDVLWQLIEGMLAKDPTARPTSDQVGQYLGGAGQALAGLPAAPRLTSPPTPTPVSPVASTVVASSASAASAASAPSSMSARSAATATGGATAVVNEAAPPKRRKRRTGFLVAGLVLALALVGGGVAVAAHLLNGSDTGESSAAATSAAPTTGVTDDAVAGATTEAPTPTEEPTPTPSSTEITTMPDLVGQTRADAESALPEGTTIDVVTTGAPNGEATGTILSTDPVAGADIPDTVTLTVASAMKTIYLADLNSLSYNSFSSQVVKLSGNSYAHGLDVSLGSGDSAESEWNLGRYFTTLNGTIGLTDVSAVDEATFTVDFYVDQVLVQTETVKFGEYKDISIDVKDGLRLKIVVTRTDESDSWDNADFAMGDFELQGDPDKVPDVDELNGNG